MLTRATDTLWNCFFPLCFNRRQQWEIVAQFPLLCYNLNKRYSFLKETGEFPLTFSLAPSQLIVIQVSVKAVLLLYAKDPIISGIHLYLVKCLRGG